MNVRALRRCLQRPLASAARLLHHRPPPSVGLVGAPFGRGQSRPGVEQGPAQIREAGLVDLLKEQGCTVKDFGDLDFEEFPDDPPVGGVKNPRAVGSATFRLSQALQAIKREGHTALMLGGDHSLALGSVHGHSVAVGDLSVVWVDAHADLNTPLTTYTGNLHGAPASFLLKELRGQIPTLPNFSWIQPCVSAQNLVYIGLRDVDPAEHFILKDLGVKFFSMTEVDRLGIGRVLEETNDHLHSRGQRPIHLSFDVDAVDPSVTPATGTPVTGGLSLREALTITESLQQTGLLSAVDLVEVNPLRAESEAGLRSTVMTAVDVIRSCFGRRREGSHAHDYLLPSPEP